MGMQLQKDFGPHFHKKERERRLNHRTSCVALHWKTLTPCFTKGPVYTRASPTCHAKGLVKKDRFFLKKSNVFHFFALHLITCWTQKSAQSCSTRSLKTVISKIKLMWGVCNPQAQADLAVTRKVSSILELSFEILCSLFKTVSFSFLSFSKWNQFSLF